MIENSYVKEKTQILKFKYNLIRQHLDSSYRLINAKLFFQPQLEKSELDRIKESLNHLINLSSSDRLKSLSLKKSIVISKKKLFKFCKPNIDWTRRRFTGDLLKIVLKNGEVIQKVFLTPQGNIIIVNRADLGFLAKLSMLR